ncbi:MAG: ferredoxin [Candidatus Aenigmarchaeota archaeon]|nr:ferredoxin [Candidatus Aenigmarchaeota archaeon]
MATYIVQYDRKGCIGAGVCAAVNPEQWVMNKDGKADLLSPQKEEGEGQFVKEIDEKELEGMKMAAEGCPANVIHIIKKDTGEKII